MSSSDDDFESTLSNNLTVAPPAAKSSDVLPPKAKKLKKSEKKEENGSLLPIFQSVIDRYSSVLEDEGKVIDLSASDAPENYQRCSRFIHVPWTKERVLETCKMLVKQNEAFWSFRHGMLVLVVDEWKTEVTESRLFRVYLKRLFDGCWDNARVACYGKESKWRLVFYREIFSQLGLVIPDESKIRLAVRKTMWFDECGVKFVQQKE
ncbi:hypothetical protein MP638_005152 [Amoeboaphelidium occidentale]|nr:hypothetical protein MP638_005152 [Amoeboaphelidium occidentale]